MYIHIHTYTYIDIRIYIKVCLVIIHPYLGKPVILIALAVYFVKV